MEYFFATQPTSYSPSSSSNSTIHNAGQPPEDKPKATNQRSANRGGTARRGSSTGATSGVKLSTDPQSVAARERRHRISNRFKILQSLVPGGSKMDTVSMLEEAINYVKFLQDQLVFHQAVMNLEDHQHPPAYVDTVDCSFPELRITDYSVPPPEYSWFQGFDEEDNCGRTSSFYGGCL